MKRNLLFLVFTFSVLCSVDAQWHSRSCGVDDIYDCSSEEFTCIWEKASKNVRVGKITTIISSGIASSGLIWTVVSGGGLAVIVPATIMTAGFITLGIGITVWSVGRGRQSKLKEYSHYNNLNHSSLKLAPSFNKNHFNNSNTIGVSATLSF